MTILGIDVSHHQGTIDFGAVARGGYSFVVIKATEGTVYTDPLFTTYRQQAHAAGLAVGFYGFVGSSVNKLIYDPTAEADYFCNAIGKLQPGEFVAEDFEPYGYTNLAGKDLVAWSKTWLDRVAARLGVNPLIYMDRSNLGGHNWAPIASTYGLWLAIYDQSQQQPSAAYWGTPAIKQFYDKQTVPGVPGPVDVDVFYGTRAQLTAYGYQGSTPDMPLTDADAELVARHVWGWMTSGGPTQAQDRLTGIDNIQLPNLAVLATQARDAAAGANQRAGDALAAINTQVVPKLATGQPVAIDATAVVTALKSDPDAVKALAEAIAAALGQRVANG